MYKIYHRRTVSIHGPIELQKLLPLSRRLRKDLIILLSPFSRVLCTLLSQSQRSTDDYLRRSENTLLRFSPHCSGIFITQQSNGIRAVPFQR